MRLWLSGALLCGLPLAIAPAWALAQGTGISERQHPWGCFQPGAWKLVRMVTETLDERGVVVNTSTTDTKTVLTGIDKEGVTLEVQSTVEVAGKRFEAEPQTIKQGFHGETCTQGLRIKPPTDGQVVIEGRQIPCRLQQVECIGPTSRMIANVFYSDTIAPYVLRRETTTTDPQGKNTLSETTVDVEAQNMPVKVLGEIKDTAVVRTVHKYAKGTVTTWSNVSPEVPGGVVSHTSKEVDNSGRLIRRSTLELISCGKEGDDTTGMSRRARRARMRESLPQYAPR